MKLLSLVLAVVFVSLPAVAQDPLDWIDRWADDNQVYVTKQVRAEAQSQQVIVDEEGNVRSPTHPSESQTAWTWMARFPTIHLIVQPTPPRDYEVTINRENCPATERSLYKVPAGPIELRVERSGKAPCLWSGTLVDSRTEEVSCNF
jgi:hypothetical protein